MLWRLSVPCAAVAALLLAASSTAADNQPAFLAATDLDPALLLSPPPADGTAAGKAELDELHRIAQVTTPEQFAQAKWDNDHEDGTMFQSAIAPSFELAALPATARMLSEVRKDEAFFATKAKNEFKRNRPWIVDGTLKTCSRDESPQSSFPSGHSTMAFAMATVLARAMPELAPQLMRRADAYAEERLECGMHYRSDIVAGEVLGTTVGVLMLRDPRFEADVDAARKELVAAHLTGMAG